jgi:hypothetical protein
MNSTRKAAATNGRMMQIKTSFAFIFSLFITTSLSTFPAALAFQIPHRPTARTGTTAEPRSAAIPTSTALQMGILDFFKTRQNDFIKLQESQDIFGPGPLLLAYNVPTNIKDEELEAMMEDGAPVATETAGKKYNSGIKIHRMYPRDLEQMEKADATVLQVLEHAMEPTAVSSPPPHPATMDDDATPEFLEKNMDDRDDPNTNINTSIPILYFSGISNQEMMQCYNIIAREVYEETNGMANPACAKVVEPAMGKIFKQLVEEISGDHAGAMRTADESTNA